MVGGSCKTVQTSDVIQQWLKFNVRWNGEAGQGLRFSKRRISWFFLSSNRRTSQVISSNYLTIQTIPEQQPDIHSVQLAVLSDPSKSLPKSWKGAEPFLGAPLAFLGAFHALTSNIHSYPRLARNSEVGLKRVDLTKQYVSQFCKAKKIG